VCLRRQTSSGVILQDNHCCLANQAAFEVTEARRHRRQRQTRGQNVLDQKTRTRGSVGADAKYKIVKAKQRLILPATRHLKRKEREIEYLDQGLVTRARD
jgi:hypothetical protein